MIATTTSVRYMSDAEAGAICGRLTNPGSEFQAEVMARQAETPVAVVMDPEGVVVAWAATHVWRGMQTLEGFTDAKHRRKGIARLAAALLVADGKISPLKEIAVFEISCVAIAKSVGFREIRLFDLIDDEWVEIATESTQ